MNYEARIAVLKARGVLNEKEAQQLKSSVDNSVEALPKSRSFSLEIAGVVLLMAILLFIGIQAGLTETSDEVENVARTLNSVRTGIGAGSTFGLLLLAAGAGGFLLFYLLVHHFFNRIWRHQEQMRAIGEMIADLEVRKERLSQRLEKVLAYKDDKSAASVHIGTTEKAEAMRILEETEASLGELQEHYAALKSVCRYEREKFPYVLASLAGALPNCE